ncbi:MAG: acyl-CoA dehydrogenase family protein [Kofleriaceae bacterium]
MLGIAGVSAGSGGLADTKKMLDSTRPVVGAQAAGIARAAYEFLLDRVRGGSLHGTPMASHQHIMFELAEMNMEITSSRLSHKGGWMATISRTSESSMAKAHGARTAQHVTRAMVLLGEEALEPGHPVEKWYRDADRIFEGTGQIQRRIIAKHLTGTNRYSSDLLLGLFDTTRPERNDLRDIADGLRQVTDLGLLTTRQHHHRAHRFRATLRLIAPRIFRPP